MILKYLEELKKECVLAPLFKMLEALFELFVPLVVASIIDRGIGQQDTAYIVKMCLMLLGLAIIGLVCSITAQYFSAKAAVGCATGIRHALFKHIQSLSFTEMDDIGTSTLMTRMTSDINQIQNGVNLVLRLFLRSPFIVFGAMIMAFTVDVKTAVVFAVAIPGLSVIVFGIMLITIPMYKVVQNSLDVVMGHTRENLSGTRVIRAFNREAQEVKEYNEETLQVTYKDKNIYDVLEMTVEEALDFFDNLPKIRNKIQTLYDVGLGYIKLGQSATTLSGGEAQRVKLASELQKKSTGKTVYILDEPTTGLHSHDVSKLIDVLQRIVDQGDTIIVIEHNLDVIKVADHIIDLGPEGGAGGGTVVVTGTPEKVAKCEKSYTGQFLKTML